MNPHSDNEVDPDTEPPVKHGLRLLAGVLLVIPILALLWVGSYAKEQPTLGGWPFFIWYQFAWIFITSALTYVAYRIILVARPHRPLGRAGAVRAPRAGDAWRHS